MNSREEIFNTVASTISELFQIPVSSITPESRFYEDLNLDSIDAIDLIGSLQVLLGQRLDPTKFKAVLTVGDVVDAAESILLRGQKNE